VFDDCEAKVTGRRGRPLEAVAEGLIVISPTAIYLWLLRTWRMANPDPAIHTQARFGRQLGRDGTFISHVEAGRRNMPTAMRKQWFDLVNLDAEGLARFLATHWNISTQTRKSLELQPTYDEVEFRLLDDALEGEVLTPQQWVAACGAASSLRLPKTLYRFSRRMADAMATSSSAEYPVMIGPFLQLPEPLVARAIRESIDAAPSRGDHAVDVLAAMDGAYSGPILRDYFQTAPDPWLERGVIEAIRRLVVRGEMAAVVDNPGKLQQTLVQSLSDTISWATRIELANLAWTLGPMAEDLRQRLAHDPDLDVRLIASARPDEAAINAVRALREDAILATLDRMYGSPIEDPLADKLVGLMMLGTTRRTRVRAAEALALSPYRDRCTQVLIKLTNSPCREVRRVAAHVLKPFPPSERTAQALTALALDDPESDVRGRAIWSLTPQHYLVKPDTLNRLLNAADTATRRCAVDLAAAARYTEGLRRAIKDADPSIAEDAKLMYAHIQSSPVGHD
jgi:hypothetical protein